MTKPEKTASPTLTGEMVTIALSNLVHSPLNARKSSYRGTSDLEASIPVHGIMQNLTVVRPERGAGKLEVIAGGRRLKALQNLAKAKVIDADYPVPCVIKDRKDAISASLIENTQREPMHPADEFAAWKALVDSRVQIEDVAAQHGVTPRVVKQRLKLANVAPELIQAYRDDETDLESLMAFAIVDDHDRQLQVWEGLHKWYRKGNAETIKGRLTDDELSADSSLAKYVGLEAYVAAGGATTTDLFGEEDTTYLVNQDLLEQLARKKLEKYVGKVRKEGWAWVDINLHVGYYELQEFGRIQMMRQDPSTEIGQRIAELEASIADLEAKIEACYEGDDEDENEAKADPLFAEQRKLEDELSTLEESLRVPNPDHVKLAGAIVTIENGQAKKHTGLIRPEDKAAAKKLAAPEGNGTGSAALTKSGHSERLTRLLTAHRTMALRAELADRPDIALAVATYQFAVMAFCRDSYPDRRRDFLTIRTDSYPLQELGDESVISSKAAQRLNSHRQHWLDTIPTNSKGEVDQEQLFAWTLEQSDECLLDLMAYCVSQFVNIMVGHEGRTHAEAIANAVPLDMNQWWAATAHSYFDHVPKATIVGVVTEVAGEEHGKKVASAKKADASKEAQDLLDGRNWLPLPLRLLSTNKDAA